MLVQNRPLESRPPRLWTVSVTCAALLLVAAAAALTISPQPATGSSQSATSSASAGSKPPTLRHVSPEHWRTKPRASASQNEPHGQVVDDKGKPIAGADVWMMPAWDPVRKRPPSHTTTDSHGRFIVPVPRVSERDLQRLWPYSAWTLWAYAAGHRLTTGGAGDQIFGLDKAAIVIRLGPAAGTPFVILGPDGQPLAGALVEPNFVTRKEFAGEPPDEIKSAVAARTNSEGRAVLTAMPRDSLGSIRVVSENLGTQTQQLAGPGSLAAGQPVRVRPGGRSRRQRDRRQAGMDAKRADHPEHGGTTGASTALYGRHVDDKRLCRRAIR